MKLHTTYFIKIIIAAVLLFSFTSEKAYSYAHDYYFLLPIPSFALLYLSFRLHVCIYIMAEVISF